MWELIKCKKNGRVIFLTTHYMDEADVLTDRKLILQNGIIRCLGTSMFLKKHFNIMYHLKVETNNLKEISNIIKNHVPNVIYSNKKKNENNLKNINSIFENENEQKYEIYDFRIPLKESIYLPELIKYLEEFSEKKIVLNNFSIFLPSLEELFVKLSLQKENSNLLNNNNNKDYSVNDKNSKSEEINILIVNENKLPIYKKKQNRPSDYSIISSLISFKF